jgi:endonuclease/exonuclease/phosphatase family metal-dependent hydrolase
VPKKKLPETEIRYFQFFSKTYPNSNFIFLGDFNCPQSNGVFNVLRNAQYSSALTAQKTTLKQQCKNEECLASEYDNVFYPSRLFRKEESGIIPFHTRFFGRDMLNARKISDHLPIFVSFK